MFFQILYPEDPGIIQIEDFGVSVKSDGVITYGLKLVSKSSESYFFHNFKLIVLVFLIIRKV